MKQATLRRWAWVHKWSSLVCTVFLLVICVTGLPLIFSDEIRDWLDDSLPYASVPADAPVASLDEIASASGALYPGEIIVSMFIDDDEPKVVVTMAPSWSVFNANRKTAHWIKFDAHTAQVLKQSKTLGEENASFLGVVLRLHRDLFAGLFGELFMAAMALLFVVAIVSGVALYGPFMRKLDFGTVRAGRSPRIKWLDTHNLFGVVTLAWTVVVGATGVMNELSTPLLWLERDVKAMLEPFKSQAAAEPSELSSPQAAFDAVSHVLPEDKIFSIVFPGAEFGSPYHYLIWSKGKEPLTSRLFTPVLVDARSGAVNGAVTMPWYLRTLQVSRPLHFGDYGGLPLKVIWALLDLVTIIILCSGLYLWWQRSVLMPNLVLEGRSNPASRPVQEAAE